MLKYSIPLWVIVCIAVYVSARSMYQTQQIMIILYPLLVCSSAAWAMLIGFRWWWQRRHGRSLRLVPDLTMSFLVLMHLLHSASFATLALVTGANPIFNIDVIRPYLVDVRFALFVTESIACGLLFRSTLQHR